MRRHQARWAPPLGLALLLASVRVAKADDSQSAIWEHHHAKIDYVGFTTLYSCSGLESKVQAILEFLGARRDMTVHASGCMGGPDIPTHTAWVDADFYSPTPAADGSADAVAARWMAFQNNYQHPIFMDSGDCELIQSMQDALTKNLAARGLTYMTDCFPHEVHDGDFKVSGEALEVIPVRKDGGSSRPGTHPDPKPIRVPGPSPAANHR